MKIWVIDESWHKDFIKKVAANKNAVHYRNDDLAKKPSGVQIWNGNTKKMLSMDAVEAISKGANIEVDKGSIAYIPIEGTLVRQATRSEEYWYGMCSMERIEGLFRTFMYHKNIVGAISPLYSGGGTVDGTDTASEAIYRFEKKKPVIGIGKAALSGGYWLLSQMTYTLATSSTDLFGSIGSYSTHYDLSGFYEDWFGIKITYIRSPKATYKLVGADNAPLSEDDRRIIEKRALNVHNEFIKRVNRGRENVNEKVFEADVYHASRALGLGLIDEIPRTDPYVRATNKILSLI